MLLLCLTMTALHGASFSASLERDTIALGETTVLNLVFEGSGELKLSPLPSIPGLVISGPQQQQSMTIVNGQQTQTLTVSYHLRPTQINTFTIPALNASIQGEIIKLGGANVILVDGVDSQRGARLAGTLTVDARLGEGSGPLRIVPVLARSKEVRDYLRCDTELSDERLQQRLAPVCASILELAK